MNKEAKDKQLVFLGRMAVLLVAVVASLLAFKQNSTILDLVAYAWAGFGAAFGPVILLSLFWKRMTNWGALFGMIVGAVTVIVWKNVGLGDTLYEIVPGFVLNLIVAVIISFITYKKNEVIEKEFDESVRLLTKE
jgi:sodium/proline symporter